MPRYPVFYLTPPERRDILVRSRRRLEILGQSEKIVFFRSNSHFWRKIYYFSPKTMIFDDFSRFSMKKYGFKFHFDRSPLLFGVRRWDSNQIQVRSERVDREKFRSKTIFDRKNRSKKIVRKKIIDFFDKKKFDRKKSSKNGFFHYENFRKKVDIFDDFLKFSLFRKNI